jgi:hypothetical protein
MKRRRSGGRGQKLGLAIFLVAGIFTAIAMAAEENPATQPSKIPPSTNPTQKVLYPKAGQTEEQQMADQLECYRWATDQSGWDPYEAYDVLVEKGYAAEQTAAEAEGGVIGGAARGAAAGVIIGAIAGDAGKGAAIGAAAGGLAGGRRSRRAQSEADSQAQAAIDEFNRGLEKWDRNYAACMGSKDYNVN